MFKYWSFTIFATLLWILLLPIELISTLNTWVHNRMLQLECWVFMDEATYNVVKRKGFEDGVVCYDCDDVLIERKRLEDNE